MQKKLLKKATAFLMSIAISVVMIPSTMINAYATDEFKEELNDLNSKYSQLQKEQKKLNNDINNAKSEKEKQLAQKTQLSQQIEVTKEQIAILEEKMAILNNNIEEKQKLIKDTKEEIDKNYDVFLKRLRAMYMTNNASTVGLILGADDFTQFLTRMEVIGKISEHDTNMIKRLVEQKKNYEEMKKQLDADLADFDGSKKEKEIKKVELSGQVQKVDQQIQDISALEQEFLNNKAKNQKAMKDLQKEIDKVYEKINSVGEYVGGIFTWPVPNFYQITSNYGPRFGGSDYHTGVDISGSGVYGKNIVAANDGTVAFVQTSYSAGVGYGKYLIIDHGGGITTLYGHTSNINVAVGQSVKKGQAIASIGSTGWSTGPHLHFEVRVNKKHVNPMTYLKG